MRPEEKGVLVLDFAKSRSERARSSRGNAEYGPNVDLGSIPGLCLHGQRQHECGSCVITPKEAA